MNNDYRPLVIDPWFRLIKAEAWNSSLVLPKFQSHRGYHAGALQENTLEAFRESRALGAKMCECDVRLSRDGIPVVFHDADLKRIGNKDSATSDLTFAELKSFAKVSSLEEMLMDAAGPELFNVELKSRKVDDPLPLSVAKVIVSLKAEGRVIFSSFNPFALWQLQKLLPTVPRALLLTNIDHKDNRWWLKRMILVPLLKIHMLNLDQAMIDESVMKFWKDQGMPVAAWTVNDLKRAKKLLSMGVVSVISDLSPREFVNSDH